MQTSTISPADLNECELVRKMTYSIQNSFCYEVTVMQTPAGVTFSLIRKPANNNQKQRYGRPFQIKLHQQRGYIVYRDGKAIGYAESGFDESENMAITQLFVVDQYRKQGIGEKLLHVIEQTAAHFRQKNILCTVDADNASGIDYLTKRGYIFHGITQSLKRKNLKDNQTAKVVLMKQLNTPFR